VLDGGGGARSVVGSVLRLLLVTLASLDSWCVGVGGGWFSVTRLLALLGRVWN
jgi:hypothetical protein